MPSISILKTLAVPLFLVASSMSMLGCLGQGEGEDDKSQIGQLTNEIRRALDATKDRVTEISPSKEEIKSLTTDELNKLSAFEYHVAEIKRDLSIEELEKELSALGLERWECFEIEQLEKSYRIFCRRRPQTYLRYIPRMFP